MKVLEISKKYIRLYVKLFSVSFSRQVIFRTDFIINLIARTVDLLAYIVLIDIIYQQFNSIGGWSKYDFMFIFGMSRLTSGILDALIFSNLRSMADRIFDGSFDIYLVKPVNPLFVLSTRDMYIFDVFESLLGVVFCIYAIFNTTIFINLNILITVILAFILVFIIFYSILLSFLSLSFYAGRISHLYYIFSDLLDISKIPRNMHTGIFKWIFTLIFPFVLFGSIPVEAFLNKVNAEVLLPYLFVALIWALFARFMWRRGVKSYTSGGG